MGIQTGFKLEPAIILAVILVAFVGIGVGHWLCFMYRQYHAGQRPLAGFLLRVAGDDGGGVR
ncbi:MAG: hypothetical protein U9P37_01060 [Pseudomonadota bacterium]|nr:hypothetical protein [Pseudomonadota bacterium]